MSKWVTVWGNATSIAERRPENYSRDITLRYPIKCAFGGSKLRLHFSNFCGTEAVTLNSVTVARAQGDRGINADCVKTVAFNGESAVTIPAGKEIVSDEVEFAVNAQDVISVSIYLKDFTIMRSAVVITGPLSKGYFSLGDKSFSSALHLNATRTTSTFYFLTGVDLLTEDKNRAVILYGDSITAQSWPDYLALNFMQSKNNDTAVIRRAASGTRVLREYECITYESYGLCGKKRFEREISTVCGADTVIIQQGINDIIHPVGEEINPFRPMSDLPSAEELEEGVDYYIRTAKKAGLKVYLGTLLPIYGWRTYAGFREELKNKFNGWARRNADINGCIDFDAALRDIKNPAAFAAGYDSGDHLHPSEEAYKKMAEIAFKEIVK